MPNLRPLGQSGLKIAPFVLGGNVFGWTLDETRSFQVLDAFTDAGFNLIDTADVYSAWVPGNQGGESEAIIGRWLKRSGKRSRVLLATKCGHPLMSEMMSEKQGEMRGLRAANIIRAAEISLRRLQTDVIDLYQSHYDDPETPFEETAAAFGKLIEQGKVRAIGASQIKAERLTQAMDASLRAGLSRYTCLQPLYNLYDREEFERSLAPVCRKHGLGVITYYSLAAGFLSGKYRSEADLGKSVRGNQRIKETYLNPKGLRIIEALDRASARLQAPMASVALAWVLANPDVTAPITSATSVEQLRDLLRGTELRLDEQTLQELRA